MMWEEAGEKEKDGGCWLPPPVTLSFSLRSLMLKSAILEETQGHLVSKWLWVLVGSPWPPLPCGF